MSVVTAGGLMRAEWTAWHPPQPKLSFLASFTPICHHGLRSELLVQCEVSLSPAVTPHFINSLPARHLGGQAPMGLQRFAAAGQEATASNCHLINAPAAVDLLVGLKISVGPFSNHISASSSRKIFKSEPHNVKILLLRN